RFGPFSKESGEKGGGRQLKRFFKNLALYALPFILALFVFFLFEPYDYFCLRGDATYLSRPLSSIRAIMLERPTRLIFGDSRMANLNTDYIEEICGEDYAMAAFGGSTLGEQLELFWFAAERCELEEVVFGVSFYMCRGEQDAGRIPAVREQAESLSKFTFNFGNWLQAADAVRWKTKNLAASLLDRGDWLEYPEDPTDPEAEYTLTEARVGEVREDLYYYAVLIYGGIIDYTLEPEVLEQLEELIDYCEAEGIKLTFVIPPMHESLFTLAVDKAGIEEERAKLLDFLKGRATVYDFEFINEYTQNEDNFYDGFHLVPPEKLTLARLIFTDTNEHPEAVERYYKD
ncbi:MAG: hypothetical protein Q4B42_08265, partial [Oscillospiraceae bacterium]|nr:hypothetical protein [Oscillospiraceae bacterium]